VHPPQGGDQLEEGLAGRELVGETEAQQPEDIHPVEDSPDQVTQGMGTMSGPKLAFCELCWQMSEVLFRLSELFQQFLEK
jgi:hypothetical protein